MISYNFLSHCDYAVCWYWLNSMKVYKIITINRQIFQVKHACKTKLYGNALKKVMSLTWQCKWSMVERKLNILVSFKINDVMKLDLEIKFFVGTFILFLSQGLKGSQFFDVSDFLFHLTLVLINNISTLML